MPDALSMEENADFGSLARAEGVSISTTFPASSTRTMSQLRTVFNLCAMVKTVQSEKVSCTVCWINRSVSASTEAVASSRTRT